MATIDILMATYNGEKYLPTQLDSIIEQTFKDWRLIIHDDGSSDNTIRILKDYTSKDSRIVLIEDGIDGLGPGKNFWHLHKYVDALYICYCDQDDYWFANNLQIKYNHISQLDNDKPQLIYFNGYYWFSEDTNNKIGCSCNHMYNYKNYSFKSMFFKNGGLQGCSMVINRTLLNRMNYPINNVWMHDQIITFYGICYNCINYYNYSLMLYRQHSLNVSGQIIQKKSELFNKNKIFSHIPVIQQKSYDSIKAFYSICKNIIPKTDYTLFKIFLEFPNLKLHKKIYYSIKYNFSCNESVIKLIIKLLCRRIFIS